MMAPDPMLTVILVYVNCLSCHAQRLVSLRSWDVGAKHVAEEYIPASKLCIVDSSS